MFYTMVDASDRGAAAVDVAELFGKRWYFVAADYEYGRESVGFTKRSLSEKYGDAFKIAGESWPKQGEVDYTSAVTNALAAKADVVYVVLPGRFAQFQKQAAALGLTKTSRIHWAYDEGPSAIAAGDAAFGVTATTTFALNIPDSALATDFAKRYQKRFGEWPGIFSVAAYQGTRMLLKAIEKAGSLDGAKIMKATHGLEDPNPVGGRPYRIRACDQHAHQSMYTSEWTKSEEYAPGYWKMLKRFGDPEAAALPCSIKANYDTMKF
jgi:branched-chain amino acid transport system substrate-binding protein